MCSNEYSLGRTKDTIAHVEDESLVIDGSAHLEGETQVIDTGNFLPQDVDYSDSNGVKRLATSAVHTADGFYGLVKQCYNTLDLAISSDSHSEMYLAPLGLACEIYVKAIIYFENPHCGKQVRGHELDTLFSKLPTSVQRGISSRIANIATTLTAIKDTFSILRFDFEQNRIAGNNLVVF